MARYPGAEPIYALADQFRQRCLKDQRSLLWPSHQAWTAGNVSSLYAAFIEHPDEGKGTFFQKWREQLADQSLDVHRVAADVIVFYFLFPTNIGQAAKLDGVREVVGWKLAAEQPDWAPIEAAFETGIGTAGPYYLTGRPWQVAFYLDFARRVLSEGADLTDRDECQRLADAAFHRNTGSQPARNILLHLLFPDQFERIASDQHKALIVGAFPEFADEASGRDDALRHIREGLGERLARSDFDFYEPDLHAEWGRNQRPPRAHGVWLFQANPDLFDLADDLTRRQISDEDEWTVTRYRNEIQPGDTILFWQGGTAAGLYATGEALTAPFERDSRTWQPEREDRHQPEWAVRYRYTRILDTSIHRDELLNHAELNGMQILRSPQGTNFRVRPAEWEHLRRLILARDNRAQPPKPTALAELAAATHMDVGQLEEIESLLVEKKQIILEGPPGSGKTYLAELFARYFTGQSLTGEPDERLEVVQFHQSYGYEDFVQGIRPQTDADGQLQYHVQDGIFKHLCELAARNPEQRFVLIIDEINRGNISRIFGELLYLLEYRGKRARLPYGRDGAHRDESHLSIPPNVYLIGTMNSTDRSLAVLDYALRRRFYFYKLLPVVDGHAPILDRWLHQQGMAEADRQRTVRLFVALNQRVQLQLSSDFLIGHSYFMRPDIATTPGLNRVWQRAILPLLDEYFHNTRDRETVVAEFTPERLLAPSDAVFSLDGT